MKYPDAANPDLLERIPLTAMTVLDVGCATGALGMQYKRLNPRVRYFGIEMDEEACLLAAERIDHVVQADVDLVVSPFGEQRFDCIIYGDVLEHLRDPWKVLTAHVALLNPGGVVLICMPNVEHWSFACRLLQGGWNYDDEGLFDRTHLRWFSLRTTHGAIMAAGLVPHDVAARIFDEAACDAFVRALLPSLQALNVDPGEYRRRAAPLQHVWRATLQPVERFNVISTMLAPIGGVSEVRVTQPMRALSTLPDMLCMVTQTAEMPQFRADSPKIFIFHRPLLAGEEGLVPIRQLIALGYVVICEFDDHPDYIPVLQRPDIQNFRAVHAVQTTTMPLAEVLAQRNPEVAVFPNAVDRLADAQNFADPNRMTLFFGGLNRENEWPGMLEPLNEAIAVAGDRLHFQIVSDEAFFHGLNTPHKTFTPLCDYETYIDLLRRCEISFMPLMDTAFNRCKSDLKYLEASAARVVSLASPTVYDQVIEDGRTGLVFHDASELRQKLLALVANPGAALAMAEAARSHVAQHRMLAYQIGARANWYHSLWARRDALNHALLARVPELAQAMEPVSQGGAAATFNSADFGRTVILPPARDEPVGGE